jgi:hypothetical protein
MNYYLGGWVGTFYGAGAGAWASHFPLYTKLTELGNFSKSPGPSQTFIFVDERSDCINWGNFVSDFSGYPLTAGAKPVGAQYQWEEDMPASYHNYAGCLSFADGHAEIHRWQDRVTLQALVPNGALQSGPGSTVFFDPYGQDVPWMQNVAARPH